MVTSTFPSDVWSMFLMRKCGCFFLSNLLYQVFSFNSQTSYTFLQLSFIVSVHCWHHSLHLYWYTLLYVNYCMVMLFGLKHSMSSVKWTNWDEGVPNITECPLHSTWVKQQFVKW
jgi:glucose-6-phosphate-specific signal transduction histidine kinase